MADGKWISGLSPEMPVEDATRMVLAARFEVVRQCLQAAADHPDDPESVHQLRVGTRRAWAAARLFADCLPQKRLKAVKGPLRDLRRAAGDVRDCDVFLASLAADVSAAPAKGRPAIDFLLGYALGERAAAQARLLDAVAEADPEFDRVSAKLPGRARPPKGGHAPRTFGELAAGHVADQFARLNAELAEDPAEPQDLHRLRIRSKRVRYVMEVVAGCFAPPFKDVLYPLVEAAQELLGQLQDAATAAALLEALVEPTKRAAADEWKRLEFGITRLTRVRREQFPDGLEGVRKWRAEWAAATEAHPLGSLQLTPAGRPPADR
jgi:CHAD domain-containing protein